MTRITLLSNDTPDQTALFYNKWAAQDGWKIRPGNAIKSPRARLSKSELITKDLAYQTGCAYFYAQKYDEAVKRYTEIAADLSSPWHDIAPYLAARALVRKSSIVEGDSDRALLQQARQALLKLENSPGAKNKQSVKDLIALTNCRMLDMPNLSASVMSGGSVFGKSVDNLTMTIDRALERNESKQITDAQIAALRADELTDWLLTFRLRDDKAFQNALGRWRKSKSTPWLVACLTLAEPRDKEMTSLIEAGSQVKPGSPGYLTINYHIARLQSEVGNLTEARELLTGLEGLEMSESSRNLLFEQHARVARNISELAKYCVVKPVAVLESEDLEIPAEMLEHKEPASSAQVFDARTVGLINSKLPLSMMKDLATEPSIPRHLKADALSAVWERAVLLNNESIAKQTGSELARLVPELAQCIGAYNEAKSVDDRRAAAIFAILKFPGLHPYLSAGLFRKNLPLTGIDEMRHNWWTTPTGPEFRDIAYSEADYWEENAQPKRGDLPALDSPGFLTSAQREQAAAEFQTLTRAGDTTEYLAKEALALAKRRPDDKRLPELLHHVILATRHTETTEAAAELSKQAYAIMRKRFAKDPWTVKTKSWY